MPSFTAERSTVDKNVSIIHLFNLFYENENLQLNSISARNGNA